MNILKDFKAAISGEAGKQALQTLKCKFHWAIMTHDDRKAYDVLISGLKEVKSNDEPGPMRMQVTIPPSITKKNADSALRQIRFEYYDTPIDPKWGSQPEIPPSEPKR